MLHYFHYKENTIYLKNTNVVLHKAFQHPFRKLTDTQQNIKNIMDMGT